MASYESGLAMVHRLISNNRPSLLNLDADIFLDKGPFTANIIEISGETNVGKTLILMEIIAKVIVPIEFGGRDATVLYIDTNADFHLPRFIQILDKHLNRFKPGPPEESWVTNIAAARESSLKKLLLQKCFSNNDLELSIKMLDDVCGTNENLCLIIVDSIAEFYWGVWSKAKPIRMDTYNTKLHDKLAAICKTHKVNCIYTTPSYFTARRDKFNCQIHYKIKLDKKVDKDCENYNIFVANLMDGNGKAVTKLYTINDFGLKWLAE